MNELTSAFSILKKKFPAYESRPQQMKMAEEVLACLKDKKKLLIEAGTGVGKSFAYLIPAILSGNKTIVSTATIALQDQLANKDLVFLQEVLPQKFSFAILKGKNNYLCLKREREFASQLSGEYRSFTKWVQETETGDKDELDFIPDFWSKVCGDSDDCNIRKCPFYAGCLYYIHYRQLHKMDILIVNHHLLLYDFLSGLSLLPFHKQLIIDEAQKGEDVISHVFGSVLSYSSLTWLLYRLRGLKIAVDHLFEPVENFFKERFFASLRMTNTQTVSPIPEDVIEKLKNLKSQLVFDKVIHRLDGQRESADDKQIEDRITTTINYINSLDGVIGDFIEHADKNKVYYIASNKKGIELRSNLVEVQMPFNGLCDGYESVIMTSATLTAGGNFNFIKERLGIVDSQHEDTPSPLSPPVKGGVGGGKAISQNSPLPLRERARVRGTSEANFKELIIGSPFDYKKQALLFLDKELPPPLKGNNDDFQQKSLEKIEGLIAASKGRALVLFTSYNHLRYAVENINITYPSKSQGDMPPSRLIQWFKKTDNAVLLATATFWQGIDIKGEKLSLVIIVKMPFGSPGDPVYDERCRRLGERWFNDLALPSAILMLRQGFGRLIRSVDDYGVVAVLDTRLITSSYGKTIISSLPEIDVVHSIEDVKRFFDSIPVSSESHAPIYKKRASRDRAEAGADKISHVAALGNSKDPSVIPELINFTNSENGNERRLAASALGKLARFKPEIYEAVEALENLLDDEKPQVRQYAMKAIAKIGKVKHERLKAVIDNPFEKGYNVSLAKKLVHSKK